MLRPELLRSGEDGELMEDDAMRCGWETYLCLRDARFGGESTEEMRVGRQ